MSGIITPVEYTIIETDSGPMISHSRISVYDVLELEQQGKNIYEICLIYELLPIQAKLAFDYIAEHRERLNAELQEILVIKRERRTYYEGLAKEIRDSFHNPIRERFAELERSYRERNGHSE